MSIAHLWFDLDFADADPLASFSAFWDCFCGRIIRPQCIRFIAHAPLADSLPEDAWPGSFEFEPFDPPLFEEEHEIPGQNLTTFAPGFRFSSMLKEKEGILRRWNRLLSEWQDNGEVSLQCWGATKVLRCQKSGLSEGWFLMEGLRFDTGVVRVPLLSMELRFDSKNSSKITLSLMSWAHVWGAWSIAQVGQSAYWKRKQGEELEAAERNARMLVNAMRDFSDYLPTCSRSWHEEVDGNEPDIAGLLRRELTHRLGESSA